MADIIKWEGASGKTYDYWIHPIGANFKDEPGNWYCQVKWSSRVLEAETVGGRM